MKELLFLLLSTLSLNAETEFLTCNSLGIIDTAKVANIDSLEKSSFHSVFASDLFILNRTLYQSKNAEGSETIYYFSPLLKSKTLAQELKFARFSSFEEYFVIAKALFDFIEKNYNPSEKAYLLHKLQGSLDCDLGNEKLDKQVSALKLKIKLSKNRTLSKMNFKKWLLFNLYFVPTARLDKVAALVASALAINAYRLRRARINQEAKEKQQKAELLTKIETLKNKCSEESKTKIDELKQGAVDKTLNDSEKKELVQALWKNKEGVSYELHRANVFNLAKELGLWNAENRKENTSNLAETRATLEDMNKLAIHFTLEDSADADASGPTRPSKNQLTLYTPNSDAGKQQEFAMGVVAVVDQYSDLNQEEKETAKENVMKTQALIVALQNSNCRDILSAAANTDLAQLALKCGINFNDPAAQALLRGTSFAAQLTSKLLDPHNASQMATIANQPDVAGKLSVIASLAAGNAIATGLRTVNNSLEQFNNNLLKTPLAIKNSKSPKFTEIE